MLAETGVDHLIFRALGDRPLVMTSGNLSGEPIVFDDAQAGERLAGIADFFLVHDRPILIRSDDSVTRVLDGTERVIRRSKGRVPTSIPLPIACPTPILAVGAPQKVTIGLGIGSRAILSHHLGDLDQLEAYQGFEAAVRHFERLFRVAPELVAHDLHPDYVSTRYARALGIPTLAIQHHHAPIASGMAEHDLDGTVIGVAFDGTGYGDDGTLWGGEFLVADDIQP
jgi:hydrogenase maturation protein HypF